MQHGTWHHQASSNTGRQSCSLPCLPQRGSPWHMCHQTHQTYGDGTFCVERCGQRRGSHMQRLPTVPAWEGPEAAYSSTPVSACRISHVHVDLLVPLPASSDGHVQLLTVIDRLTRWVEDEPLHNMEASRCMDTHSQLAGMFWHAGHCHNRPWNSVHISSADQYLHGVGDRARAHYCFPS